MVNLSIQDVATYEYQELDTETQSWVCCVNHCFTQDTEVEHSYDLGLYISVIGQCQYQSLNETPEEQGNYTYHYAVAIADEPCKSHALFPADARWQTLLIKIPLDQLHVYGVDSLNEMTSHFRPEARLSELGTISGDILKCCELVWSCDFVGIERELFIKAKALEILSLFLHKRRESSKNKLSIRLTYLSDALEHIENNLDQEWSLSAVAQLARSNQTYIKKDVKFLIGMSFHKWLNKKRLSAAVELLSKDIAISQIASDIGFKSQAHFSTLFKNEMGMRPSEYRQSLTSNIF